MVSPIWIGHFELTRQLGPGLEVAVEDLQHQVPGAPWPDTFPKENSGFAIGQPLSQGIEFDDVRATVVAQRKTQFVEITAIELKPEDDIGAIRSRKAAAGTGHEPSEKSRQTSEQFIERGIRAEGGAGAGGDSDRPAGETGTVREGDGRFTGVPPDDENHDQDGHG